MVEHDGKFVTPTERLRIPAPRHESAGYWWFIGSGLVMAAWWAVQMHKVFPGVSIWRGALLLIAVSVLPLIHVPQAFWSLLFIIVVTWIASLVTWIGSGARVATAITNFVNPGWAVTAPLWAAYFWRRRWWYGIHPHVSVPERSPKGGLWGLVFGSLVLGVAVIVLLAALAGRL